MGYERGRLTRAAPQIDSQGNALAPRVRIERVSQGPAETAMWANTRMQVTGVSGLAAQPVAGQMLWLTDESGSGLIVCRLAWAELNPLWSDNPPWVLSGKRGWVIRCYTEDGDVARPGTTLRSWLPRAVLLGRIEPAGRY